MTLYRRTSWFCLLGLLGATGTASFLAYWYWPEPGDERLAGFVRARPPVPIVFTSRSEPASFVAAPNPGAGFTVPGQGHWQAREGRLRLLTPTGQVRELTWGRTLPDGDTLIDVLSPSISPDGRTVVFAGRRAGVAHGRFRIYAIGVDGRGLRQLTGTADDPGCSALPPLRYAADGSLLDETTRRQLDYDDVDPILLDDGTLIFSSSRLPDLGGQAHRRAFQLWVRPADTPNPHPLTASRAADRWPYQVASGQIIFSLWSRHDEVIAHDGRSLARLAPGQVGLTAPVDRWPALSILRTGERFGALVKTVEPVWRPRPLGNGRVVFMTTTPPVAAQADTPQTIAPLTIAQATPGYVASAPSSLAAGQTLPPAAGTHRWYAPATTPTGQRLSLATPSFAPPNLVLVAFAEYAPHTPITPGQWCIASLPQDGWDRPESLVPQVLFDDPELVDAEPVAVYPRAIDPTSTQAPGGIAPPGPYPLADGSTYTGPSGQVHTAGVYFRETLHFPGNQGADGRPIITPFPPGSIQAVGFWLSERDRFDDPARPIIPGELRLLRKVPIDTTTSGTLTAWLPAGVPTLLAGLDSDGVIVHTQSAGAESPRFYALAGDHVSAVRANGYHFCTGCHTGHSHDESIRIAELRR
jgi:hypothetical protein